MNGEIFRDQIWNFIGVIIAGVALLFTVIFYFLQKHKKGLSYEILSKTSLLTIKEKLEGKIKILYNNQAVQNVKFLEIKVLSTGNIGIPSSDYEKPLRFIFEAEAKILTAEIIKSDPDSLTPTLNLTQNEIVVQPILMNSKDYFVMKVIISNSSAEDVIVDGRIKDVKNIKKQGESYMGTIFGIVGFILTILGILQATSMNIEIHWTLQKIIGVTLIVIGYIFIAGSIFIRIKHRRSLFFLKKS